MLALLPRFVTPPPALVEGAQEIETLGSLVTAIVSDRSALKDGRPTPRGSNQHLTGVAK